MADESDYPVLERLRSLMGNAPRAAMRSYERTAADAIYEILRLRALIRSFERADVEYRRALDAGTQPRLSKAGTRYQIAKSGLFAAIKPKVKS